MANISVEWTKHLPSDKKEDFIVAIRNSTLMGRRLLQIVTEWEADILKSERNDNYTDAAWAYKQAGRNKQLELIQKLKDLFNFLGTQNGR